MASLSHTHSLKVLEPICMVKQNQPSKLTVPNVSYIDKTNLQAEDNLMFLIINANNYHVSYLTITIFPLCLIFSLSLYLPTDSTKINRPENNISMY